MKPNPAEKAIAYLREVVEEPPRGLTHSYSADRAGAVLAYADNDGNILRYGRSYDRTIATQAPARLSRQQVLARGVSELFAFQEMAAAEHDDDMRQEFIYSARDRLDLLREFTEEGTDDDRAELGVIWRRVQADRAAQAGRKFYVHTTRVRDGIEVVDFSNSYSCVEHALVHLAEGETQKIVGIAAEVGP